jgi:hypothetical protein
MFLPPTLILDPVIYPFADKFYPAAILIKHHTWFLLTANLFISLDGVLYSIHQLYFDQSPLFQEIIHCGETDEIGVTPLHPIFFDMLKKETFSTYYTLEWNDWNTLIEKIGST